MGGFFEGQPCVCVSVCVSPGKPIIKTGCQGTQWRLRGITHYPMVSHLLQFTVY